MASTAPTLLAQVPDRVGERLRSLNLSHTERGIFPSEMAAVCGVVEALGATRIIESGRWFGFSTEVLAKYFEGSAVQIDSLEYFRTDQALACEQRLADCHNVRLLYGDSTKVVPGMLEGRPEPTVLLFDGPKGEVAVTFLRKVMDTYPNVRAAFLHDSYAGSEGRAAVMEAFPDRAFTDDPAFVARFSYLDAGVADVIASLYPEKCSGDPRTFPDKSYGPTLALMVPETDDTHERDRYSPLEVRFLYARGRIETILRNALYPFRHLFRMQRNGI